MVKATLLFDEYLEGKFLWWSLSKFSMGTLVSSTNKTDQHNITEILLKVALNTLTLSKFIFFVYQKSKMAITSGHIHTTIIVTHTTKWNYNTQNWWKPNWINDHLIACHKSFFFLVGHDDITEILLKVALNTIILIPFCWSLYRIRPELNIWFNSKGGLQKSEKLLQNNESQQRCFLPGNFKK